MEYSQSIRQSSCIVAYFIGDYTAMTGRHQIKGYEYQICVYSKGSDSYLGVILMTARDGVPFSPIIEIPTLTHFGAERAAQIEADALALELIHTGAIDALLPSRETILSPPISTDA